MKKEAGKRYIKGLIIAVIVFLMFQGPGRVAVSANGEPARPGRGQAIMVIIDRMTWDDFRRHGMPVMKSLVLEGAVGLMTTNPAGGTPRIPENTYSTIGAGAKISGGLQGGAGYTVSEKYENDTAGDTYKRLTGQMPGEVAYLGLGELVKANRSNKYDFTAGAIGTVLRQNGLKTAVIGNADMPGYKKREDRFRRQAVTIAMDNSGRVDYGDVSEHTCTPDPESPAGVKTDYAYMLKEFSRLRGTADFVVMETGDLSRVDESSHTMLDDVPEGRRRAALLSADRFLGSLLAQIDLSRDMLMVVVPGPSTAAMDQGRFLTPFVMAGRGVGKGLAWSGSIKRDGLIANIDIAPSITEFFGLPAVIKGGEGETDINLGGQPVEGRKTADSLAEVTRLYEDTAFLYNSRYPLVKGYINTELAAVILFIILTALGKPSARYFTPLFIAFTAVPGVMLWANYLPHPSVGAVAAEIILLTGLITSALLVLARGRPMMAFLVTTGLTLVLIVADLFAGAPLAKTSPFSYDAMSGARFYGLGNEYMGVLIGSVIAFSALLFDTLKTGSRLLKPFALGLFLVVIYTIASPGLGTNVGGTIAAVAGLGFTAVILFGGGVSRKSLAAVVVGITVILAVFIAYDLTRTVATQSHIGRTVSLIRENGLTEIGKIISRKWEMNFQLIKNSSWSWFYGICLLGLCYLGRFVPEKRRKLAEEFPWFNKSISAVVAGSVFALLFNDSGIVAASTMVIFAAAPYFTGLAGNNSFSKLAADPAENADYENADIKSDQLKTDKGIT